MIKSIQIAIFVCVATWICLSNSCEKMPKEVAMDKNQIDIKLAEGFVLFEVTKKFSEGDCGYLLKEMNTDEVRLNYPIAWPDKIEAEGKKILIQGRPSRIKQDKCFNAQPMIIDTFILIKQK